VCGSLVQYLPSIHEDLGSIHGVAKIRIRIIAHNPKARMLSFYFGTSETNIANKIFNPFAHFYFFQW
jgi:hypothetical protein